MHELLAQLISSLPTENRTESIDVDNPSTWDPGLKQDFNMAVIEHGRDRSISVSEHGDVEISEMPAPEYEWHSDDWVFKPVHRPVSRRVNPLIDYGGAGGEEGEE